MYQLNFGRVIEALSREPLVDLPQDGREAFQERRERREHLGFVVGVASAVVAIAAASAAAPGDG